MAKEGHQMLTKSAMKSYKNGAWLPQLEVSRKTVTTGPHYSQKQKTER